MDCGRVEERLHELADGEVSPGEEAALRRHLESCRECAGIYDGITRLKELVSRTERPPVPASLIRAVRRDLESPPEPTPARASSREPRPRRRTRGLRWIAAALLVLAGIGALIVDPAGWFDVPLAHARVLRGCSEHYGILDKSGLDPIIATSGDGYRGRVRSDVRRLLEGKLELEWVPFLKNALYCGASVYHCPDTGHRLGVRLDYLIRRPDAVPSTLCVYVVRLESHPLSDDLREELGTGAAREHACECVEEAHGNHTVSCWLSDSLLYTFVSDVSRRMLCEELGAHLCNQS